MIRQTNANINEFKPDLSIKISSAIATNTKKQQQQQRQDHLQEQHHKQQEQQQQNNEVDHEEILNYSSSQFNDTSNTNNNNISSNNNNNNQKLNNSNNNKSSPSPQLLKYVCSSKQQFSDYYINNTLSENSFNNTSFEAIRSNIMLKHHNSVISKPNFNHAIILPVIEPEYIARDFQDRCFTKSYFTKIKSNTPSMPSTGGMSKTSTYSRNTDRKNGKNSTTKENLQRLLASPIPVHSISRRSEANLNSDLRIDTKTKNIHNNNINSPSPKMTPAIPTPTSIRSNNTSALSQHNLDGVFIQHVKHKPKAIEPPQLISPSPSNRQLVPFGLVSVEKIKKPIVAAKYDKRTQKDLYFLYKQSGTNIQEWIQNKNGGSYTRRFNVHCGTPKTWLKSKFEAKLDSNSVNNKLY